jgi:hypothetical protein
VRDEQANQIIQRLTKIEEVLQAIAQALSRIAPPEKGRKRRDEPVVFLPRVEPEPPPLPPGAPPIIKSRRGVTSS